MKNCRSMTDCISNVNPQEVVLEPFVWLRLHSSVCVGNWSSSRGMTWSLHSGSYETSETKRLTSFYFESRLDTIAPARWQQEASYAVCVVAVLLAVRCKISFGSGLKESMFSTGSGRCSSERSRAMSSHRVQFISVFPLHNNLASPICTEIVLFLFYSANVRRQQWL